MVNVVLLRDQNRNGIVPLKDFSRFCSTMALYSATTDGMLKRRVTRWS